MAEALGEIQQAEHRRRHPDESDERGVFWGRHLRPLGKFGPQQLLGVTTFARIGEDPRRATQREAADAVPVRLLPVDGGRHLVAAAQVGHLLAGRVAGEAERQAVGGEGHGGGLRPAIRAHGGQGHDLMFGQGVPDESLLILVHCILLAGSGFLDSQEA